MKQDFRVLDLMDQGGPIMWVLLGLSFVALAVTVERGIAILMARRRNHQARGALGGIVLELRGLGPAEAEEARAPARLQGPLGHLLSAGLRRAGKGAKEAERAMEIAAGVEMRRLQRGMIILATVANLAPLLGFLGTAFGMMVSFEAISNVGLSEPGLVADGIKVALTTTVAGLAVAIPVQFAYNLLASQIDTIVGELEHAGAVLLEAVTDDPVLAPSPRS